MYVKKIKEKKIVQIAQSFLSVISSEHYDGFTGTQLFTCTDALLNVPVPDNCPLAGPLNDPVIPVTAPFVMLTC
jgi:hypothetical protein